MIAPGPYAWYVDIFNAREDRRRDKAEVTQRVSGDIDDAWGTGTEQLHMHGERICMSSRGEKVVRREWPGARRQGRAGACRMH